MAQMPHAPQTGQRHGSPKKHGLNFLGAGSPRHSVALPMQAYNDKEAKKQ